MRVRRAFRCCRASRRAEMRVRRAFRCCRASRRAEMRVRRAFRASTMSWRPLSERAEMRVRRAFRCCRASRRAEMRVRRAFRCCRASRRAEMRAPSRRRAVARRAVAPSRRRAVAPSPRRSPRRGCSPALHVASAPCALRAPGSLTRGARPAGPRATCPPPRVAIPAPPSEPACARARVPTTGCRAVARAASARRDGARLCDARGDAART